MKVLLVEDDLELARQVCADLNEENYEVQVENTGPGALKASLRGRWDVVILDVALPGLSGFEILEQMRARQIDTPVIFLTARGEVADRVRGLWLGADDYLTKPFAKDELKARLHALRRRYANVARSTQAEPALPEGWKMNPLLRQLTVGGETVSLQPREWSLLQLFLNHEGQVLTKSFLLDRVWGIRFDPGTNVVDAVVCRLRSKLDEPGKDSHLRTCLGRGYVFHRDV
jgi:DNA-binding response OmpR family regulator